MTLIGRKILLTNTDDSGNPTLDFPITSIECVEGGASQGNLETLQAQLANLSELVGTLKSQFDNFSINLDGIADYIVESYRNGTEWYEVYHSGKIRQGGYNSIQSTSIKITLLKPFVDTNYTVLIGVEDGEGKGRISSKTTTYFYLFPADSWVVGTWIAEGQGL